MTVFNFIAASCLLTVESQSNINSQKQIEYINAAILETQLFIYSTCNQHGVFEKKPRSLQTTSGKAFCNQLLRLAFWESLIIDSINASNFSCFNGCIFVLFRRLSHSYGHISFSSSSTYHLYFAGVLLCHKLFPLQVIAFHVPRLKKKIFYYVSIFYMLLKSLLIIIKSWI